MHKSLLLGVAVVLLTAGRSAAEPDYWDPRLTDLGVFWGEIPVPSGQWYWRLVRAEFENEQQAGGRHHVYYKCLDPLGNPIEGMLTWTGWPTANPTNWVWQLTKGPLDGYWGNYAMSGGNWCPFWPTGPRGPYIAAVDFFILGASDMVAGMGMPCNRHVCYRLTWQLTIRP